MPHYVSSLAKEMLDYGDWIIKAVKYCAPLGSGNNHSPHSGPCHSSNSTAVVLDGDNLMFTAEKYTVVYRWIERQEIELIGSNKSPYDFFESVFKKPDI